MEVGQAMLPQPKWSWDEWIAYYIEHKLDLTRPDEITEKNTNKAGITEISNILTG